MSHLSNEVLYLFLTYFYKMIGCWSLHPNWTKTILLHLPVPQILFSAPQWFFYQRPKYQWRAPQNLNAHIFIIKLRVKMHNFMTFPNNFCLTIPQFYKKTKINQNNVSNFSLSSPASYWILWAPQILKTSHVSRIHKHYKIFTKFTQCIHHVHKPQGLHTEAIACQVIPLLSFYFWYLLIYTTLTNFILLVTLR